MTRTQMITEIARLETENTRLRGNGKPGIAYPRAYACSTYQIDATVHPKSMVILEGLRPNMDILDATRGQGMHKVTPFKTVFRIGDSAVYDGYNFDYFGTVVAIGPKTVTIESNGHKRRLTIDRFAFWNRRSKEASIRERNNWSD